MQVLVTGAAGFIGSNFVRHWVNEHPDDGVVALDLLTYAGNRENLADVADRITFVEGDIGDLDLVAGVLEPRVDRRDRELRRRVAQQPRGARPACASSAPTCSARRRCSRRRAATASPASTTSRRARSTATSRSTTPGSFTEDSPYRPRTPYNASKASADHYVRAYHETFGVPDHDLELLEQLRAVPVPGEGRPVLHDARARRPAAPAVRVDATTDASGSTCSTTAARSSRSCSDGRDRRDLQRRERPRGQHRGDRRPRARHARQARRR